MSGDDTPNRRVTIVPPPLAESVVETDVPAQVEPGSEVDVPTEADVPVERVETKPRLEASAPAQHPPPAPLPPDPMAAARAALANARAARGATDELTVPAVDLADPMAAAHAALAKASAARSTPESAEHKLSVVMAEARLRRLKRALDPNGADDE